MSNENSTTNSPLGRDQKKRTRCFSCVTYLSESQLRECLRKHSNNIKAYAFMLHDKDEGKEPHRHLLISLVNATTANAVRLWFSGYADDKGQLINTLCQPTYDATAQYMYLSHRDVMGQPLDDKYLYDEKDIVSFNADVFKDPAESDKDSISCAVMDLLEGMPLKDVALKYGRDFIIHYQSIKILMNDIMSAE